MAHKSKGSKSHTATWPKSRRKAAQRRKAKVGRKKSAYPTHINPYGAGGGGTP